VWLIINVESRVKTFSNWHRAQNGSQHPQE
jgi:hypothetical protein